MLVWGWGGVESGEFQRSPKVSPKDLKRLSILCRRCLVIDRDASSNKSYQLLPLIACGMPV